jgi:hypothetical protein
MEEETYAASSMTQNQKKSNIVQSAHVRNRSVVFLSRNDRSNETSDISEDYYFTNVTHPSGVTRTIFWKGWGDTSASWIVPNRATAARTNGYLGDIFSFLSLKFIRKDKRD